jgi:chaperonin GroES
MLGPFETGSRSWSGEIASTPTTPVEPVHSAVNWSSKPLCRSQPRARIGDAWWSAVVLDDGPGEAYAELNRRWHLLLHEEWEPLAMKLEPLGDKVVVKRMDAEETTAGGIVLPDSARTIPLQGRVLSVGDGRLLPDGTRATPQISEGDRVVFHPYAGTDVKLGDDEMLLLSEDDILAVLE